MNTEELARKIRIDAIKMVHEHHASHISSALSVADILAVLYGEIIQIDPKNPTSDNRDRVILSKGHAGVAMYAVLAETGFFKTEELKNYYSNGSVLSGHVSHKGVPGVEISTGSLGHGVCVATGMAFAAKRNRKKHRVYAIIGDGECDEGSVWEMALFAHHYRLNNLSVIIDHNGMQAMGTCDSVLDLMDLKEKWKAFGWNVVEIEDGNNHEQLRKALRISSPEIPTCIIANTIKGKGVSFMENNLLWHYRDPQGQDYINAMKELGAEDYA